MCRVDKKLLYDYADDSIDPLEKIILEEHLKYCEECRRELNEIKNMELSLNEFNFEDINIPDRLSALRELVYDNCLNELCEGKESIIHNNYKESMKQIKSTALYGYKLSYKNPCNRLITKNINSGAGIVKKAAAGYCKNKLKKSRFANSTLFKILKVV